jgi:hypothetical protein
MIAVVELVRVMRAAADIPLIGFMGDLSVLVDIDRDRAGEADRLIGIVGGVQPLDISHFGSGLSAVVRLAELVDDPLDRLALQAVDFRFDDGKWRFRATGESQCDDGEANPSRRRSARDHGSRRWTPNRTRPACWGAGRANMSLQARHGGPSCYRFGTQR